jgi:hydroxymethylglutaryl-CoA reductase (NADPH)
MFNEKLEFQEQLMDSGRASKLEVIHAPRAASPLDEAVAAAMRRWASLDADGAQAELLDDKARANASAYQLNIESYIGTVNTPVGIAGPLRVHGRSGTTDYRVPLATTEAALVASYNRGSRLLTAAGGCNARVVDEAVNRTPMFAFESVREAEAFADFFNSYSENLAGIVAGVTSHGQLLGTRTVIEGNHVYLDLRYKTEDASGQNMITFASDAICKAILEKTPVTPEYWFLEANLSGDKKATAQVLGAVRGKRVVADVRIPRELVCDQLHATPRQLVDYWYASAVGAAMSGSCGIQGHFANGLAALYLACGQDVACVAESATGITRMELTEDGDLYASVTLPNIMVGTVGGGTGLPSANACLRILGLVGTGKSTALAEVAAAIVLAGELSIAGAFCSGDFAVAHHSLSRGLPLNRGGSNE